MIVIYELKDQIKDKRTDEVAKIVKVLEIGTFL
jgi:hypothetical protein